MLCVGMCEVSQAILKSSFSENQQVIHSSSFDLLFGLGRDPVFLWA